MFCRLLNSFKDLAKVNKYTLISSALFILISCNPKNQHFNEKAIARAFEKELYPSDIQRIIPEDMNMEDSIALIQNYIDDWIKEQLKIRKSEINLSDDQKDVSLEVEEYRNTLLVYKYEQNLINQKLDTTIQLSDIESFYEQNTALFKLDKDIVQNDYVKVPRIAPEVYRVRTLMKSDKNSDHTLLDEYCTNHATEYSFSDEWNDLDSVIAMVPLTIYGSNEQFLKYNSFIEAKDSTHKYFINIKQYKLKNDTIPLPLIADKISDIILNKRKLQLLKEMENDMLQTAKKQGNIEIY